MSIDSFLTPSFAKMIADPEVKTIMMCGCGGGFDFVHGMSLYPELHRLGKRVIIATYTFGKGDRFKDAEFYWQSAPGAGDKCLKVNGSTQRVNEVGYAPDVLSCRFLDKKYPEEAPHSFYTMYARAFTIKTLHELYTKICEEENVDAVLVIDGGSDSLMVGNEAGLGDPIEDAVSVGAVHKLSNMKWKLLVSLGFGCDRYNDVSDAASLRAVAELTRAGGFRGCLSMEPTNPGFLFYKELVNYINENQDFHSVIAGSIVAAASGWFGNKDVPEDLSSRINDGKLYLWPLMSQYWAFDIDAVVKRSKLIPLIMDTDYQETVKIVESIYMGETFEKKDAENLPRIQDFSRKYRNGEKTQNIDTQTENEQSNCLLI